METTLQKEKLMAKVIGIGIGLFVFVTVLVVVFGGISWSNTAVALQNTTVAQVSANKADYDKF
jgi:hypothetical protein